MGDIGVGGRCLNPKRQNRFHSTALVGAPAASRFANCVQRRRARVQISVGKENGDPTQQVSVLGRFARIICDRQYLSHSACMQPLKRYINIRSYIENTSCFSLDG